MNCIRKIISIIIANLLILISYAMIDSNNNLQISSINIYFKEIKLTELIEFIIIVVMLIIGIMVDLIYLLAYLIKPLRKSIKK